MKFLIFICNRIRHGAFPRLPDFQYNEQHGQWCYQGRELTAEEFNAAAKVVYDPNYRNNGYSFRPVVAVCAPIEEVPSAPPAPADSSDEDPADPPDRFAMDGKSILLDGLRIAGLFGDNKQLRVISTHSDLRPAIEEWLNSQPQY